jgi:signal transduction histidine kinase
MSHTPRSGSRRRPSRRRTPPSGRVPVARSHGGDAEREELLRLASEAAHQIKAPLSTIQTILGTLMAGFAGPLQPRQRWLLEKAVERCGHGVKVVRDLMKLRSLANLDDEALGPVDLVGVFGELRDAFQDMPPSGRLTSRRAPTPSGRTAGSTGSPSWCVRSSRSSSTTRSSTPRGAAG